MRNKTLALVCFLGLLPFYLALAGCSGMEKAYKAIELGKPLDMSVIPKSAVARHSDQPKEGSAVLFHDRASWLPNESGSSSLYVEKDEHGNVVRVILDESPISYWLVIYIYSDKARERFIGDDGKPQEKVTKDHSFTCSLIRNFGDFMMISCMSFYGMCHPPNVEEPVVAVPPPGDARDSHGREGGPTTAPAP